MLSAHLFLAVFVVILATVLLGFRWEELDVGERIYGCAFTFLMLVACLYVPYRNPDTQGVVHAFVWQPMEYPDEQMAKILTPDTIREIEEDRTIAVSEDWAASSLKRDANVALGRHRLYLISLMLLGGVGWFIVPPLLTSAVFRERGRR